MLIVNTFVHENMNSWYAIQSNGLENSRHKYVLENMNSGYAIQSDGLGNSRHKFCLENIKSQLNGLLRFSFIRSLKLNTSFLSFWNAFSFFRFLRVSFL